MMRIEESTVFFFVLWKNYDLLFGFLVSQIQVEHNSGYLCFLHGIHGVVGAHVPGQDVPVRVDPDAAVCEARKGMGGVGI